MWPLCRYLYATWLRDPRPVLLAELRQALGDQDPDLDARIQRHVERGHATLDAAAITGYAGLSVVPAPHALDVAGVRLWTWCALDAVAIPAAFGLSARVRSAARNTERPFAIDVRDGVVQDADPVLSLLLVPPDQEGTMYGGTCTHIAFYDAPLPVPPTGGCFISVTTAARWGRQLWDPFAGRAARRPPRTSARMNDARGVTP